ELQRRTLRASPREALLRVKGLRSRRSRVLDPVRPAVRRMRGLLDRREWGSKMTQKTAKKTAARARQAKQGGKYLANLRILGGDNGPKNSPKPWTCTKCNKPIAAGDGTINVMDAENGGHPRRATSSEVRLTPVAIEERRKKGEPTEPPF